MIDQALVEKIWSLSGAEPAYLAAMRRVCLPRDTAVSPSSALLAELPRLFCELHGGVQTQLIPVITAWTLLRYTARILDDVEDNACQPTHQLDPCYLNVSTGLIFTAGMSLNFLEEFAVSSTAAIEIRQRFYGELLKTCGGQHADLTTPAPSLEEWWEIAGAKSGVFLGLICWAGGRVADAPPAQLELYHQYGFTLGLLDQIRDDLADLWSGDTQRSDLHHAHNRGLPLAYALAVLPDDKRQRLLATLHEVGDSAEAEQMVHNLIIKSGAGVYLNVQSIRLHQQGLALIAQMGLPDETGQKLTDLLNKARLPVNL
ncbi:MAG: polyprenyl synthetase family protein [Anaerolineae bacterium]|nr:polyprenyl synthetase family protein [Anaerolineae bacterium]